MLKISISLKQVQVFGFHNRDIRHMVLNYKRVTFTSVHELTIKGLGQGHLALG